MNISYEDAINISYQLLDLIDVRSYITSAGIEVETIMRNIEGDYFPGANNCNQEALEFMEQHLDYFEGYVFNLIDEYEFIQYCKDRYPKILWGQEIIERNYVSIIRG